MHQSLFIINRLFHRNHGFGAAHTINIVDFKDDILRMSGISSSNLTKDIELACRDVRYSYERYFFKAL
jgi:hypothetical protein